MKTKKVFSGIWVGGALVIFGLFACGAGWAMDDTDDAGTAPGYVKKSAAEEKAIATTAPGVNVQGESGGFNDYLNDDVFPTDDEMRLVDVDANSRVVVGDDAAPAGVAYKKSYEKSPVTE